MLMSLARLCLRADNGTTDIEPANGAFDTARRRLPAARRELPFSLLMKRVTRRTSTTTGTTPRATAWTTTSFTATRTTSTFWATSTRGVTTGWTSIWNAMPRSTSFSAAQRRRAIFCVTLTGSTTGASVLSSRRHTSWRRQRHLTEGEEQSQR